MRGVVQIVRVRNRTRGTTVADAAEVARSPWRRFVGLMGRRVWEGTDGLLIRPCSAVHIASCVCRSMWSSWFELVVV
jgi:hypothetical protein